MSSLRQSVLMADGFTLVVAGVAGAAGKLTEIACSGGVTWLRERFSKHSGEVQVKAQSNANMFLERLATRISELEDKVVRFTDRFEQTVKEPQFSLLLQKTLLNAAKTDNETKLGLLAELVADRLTKDSETTFSLAAEMASDAIAQLTPSQIQLLALCYFLEEIRPAHLSNAPYFLKWLNFHLGSFDFETVGGSEQRGFNASIDVAHLVANQCISYTPGSERDLKTWLATKAGPTLVIECLEQSFDEVTNFVDLDVLWASSLSGVHLTSVGSIVGCLAWSRLHSREITIPGWADDD